MTPRRDSLAPTRFVSGSATYTMMLVPLAPTWKSEQWIAYTAGTVARCTCGMAVRDRRRGTRTLRSKFMGKHIFKVGSHRPHRSSNKFENALPALLLSNPRALVFETTGSTLLLVSLKVLARADFLLRGWEVWMYRARESMTTLVGGMRLTVEFAIVFE